MNKHNQITQKAAERAAFERIVRYALELHPAFRRVFLLCDLQGFTIAEAATILGISPGAATIRLDRARREMKIKLQVGLKTKLDFAEDPAADFATASWITTDG